MRLYQTVPDCEESEAEHLSPVHWCCVAYEAVPGRWVPWCVEHDASGLPCGKPGEELCAGGAVLRWVRAPVKPCRWHPQGAFIPEVDA